MDSLPPHVSVIIPTYNRASLLGRSIKSVLSQTFQDFEIIVVDDASVDNTEEVVRIIGDPRILYLKHETNSGGSAARNTGIKAARGDFIAFQDSDDEWLPEKLEKQIKIMADAPPNVGVVYTGFWRIQGDKKEYIPGPEVQVKEGNIHRELLKGNFVTTQVVVVKKECFEKAGMFDETLPRLQDWELFLRIAKHFEFRYVPEPLVNSFYTEDSISSNPKALIEAFEITLKKNLEEYKVNQPLYAGRLLYLSNLYRLDNNMKRSRQCLIEAIKANCRLGFIVALTSSFLGIRFFNFYWDLINKIQGRHP